MKTAKTAKMAKMVKTAKTKTANSLSAPRKLVGLALAFPLLLTGCASDSTRQIEPLTSAIQLGTTSENSATPSPMPTATASASPSQSPTESQMVFDRDAEIEIEDQTGSGQTVIIEEFEVGIDNLWLVIQDESGQVLHAQLTNTSFKPVTLTLNRAITKSQELFASLYLDDGDGMFESSKDLPVYEEPGELVGEDFEYSIG